MLNGTLPSRPYDSLAFAISFDRINSRKVSLIRAENALASLAKPIPSAETDFELDYVARLTPWLIATPDIQYILHPGGGIPDPQNHAEVEPNAVLARIQFRDVFYYSEPHLRSVIACSP